MYYLPFSLPVLFELVVALWTVLEGQMNHIKVARLA